MAGTSKIAKRAAGTSPDYEESKRLVAAGEAAERRRLAVKNEVAPELLYYMAEDPDPQVRRSVAANPATPRHADVLLAGDSDDEVRTALAQKVGRACADLDERTAAKNRHLTLDVVGKLSRDLLPKVRQTLATEIKSLKTVPKDMVARLARDIEVGVSAPVLEFSPLLEDGDLIEILTSSVNQAAGVAIARRDCLSSDVCEAIAESRETHAVVALLLNQSAQIREETLDDLITDAPHHVEWHQPLVRRPNLPTDAIERVARFVTDSLVRELKAQKNVTPEVERQLDELAAHAAINAARAPDADLRDADFGAADEEMLVAKTHAGDHDYVVHALANITGINAATIHRIVFKQKSAKSIVALTWKAGFSMTLAEAMQADFASIASQYQLRAGADRRFPMTEEKLAARWKIIACEAA